MMMITKSCFKSRIMFKAGFSVAKSKVDKTGTLFEAGI